MDASSLKSLVPGPDSHRASEPVDSEELIDLALLEDSLAKTVWERMLANDDALRLADLLRTAMLNARAES